MPVTKAQQRAVGKYEKENYDKVLLRLPKGNREKIKGPRPAEGHELECLYRGLDREGHENRGGHLITGVLFF